jgi:hypothetical protein
MPKDYLNKTEREHFGLTYAMHFVVQDHLKDLEGDERKYLKSALTFYQKFMEQLAKRVGSVAMTRMQNDFKNSHVYYASSKPKGVKTMSIEIDAVHDLAEGVIEGFCKRCKDPEMEECTIRNIFLEAEVPVIGTRCLYYE